MKFSYLLFALAGLSDLLKAGQAASAHNLLRGVPLEPRSESKIEGLARSLQSDTFKCNSVQVSLDFDVSGTMEGVFDEGQKAIEDLAKFVMSSPNNHMSIIQFANSAQLKSAPLSSPDSASRDQVLNAVRTTNYRGGGTNLGKSLQTVHNDVKNAAAVRTDPEQTIYALVFTDAVADDEALAIATAQEILKIPNVEIGCLIFKNAANLEDSNNKEFIEQICRKENIAFFPDVASLKDIVAKTNNILCDAVTQQPSVDRNTASPSVSATLPPSITATTPDTTASPTSSPTSDEQKSDYSWLLFLPFVFYKEDPKNYEELEYDEFNDLIYDAPQEVREAFSELDWVKGPNGKWSAPNIPPTKIKDTSIDYVKHTLYSMTMGIIGQEKRAEAPRDQTNTAHLPKPPYETKKKKAYTIPKKLRIIPILLPLPIGPAAILPWVLSQVAATLLPAAATPWVTAKIAALTKISTWLDDHPEKYSLLLPKIVQRLAGRKVSEQELKEIIERLKANGVKVQDIKASSTNPTSRTGVTIDPKELTEIYKKFQDRRNVTSNKATGAAKEGAPTAASSVVTKTAKGAATTPKPPSKPKR